MYVIAFTLIFVGQTQLAPEHKPFELRPGDETYFITYRDGRAFEDGKKSKYVRRKSVDKDPATNTVKYYYDDFDKSSTSPWPFSISDVTEELESDYRDQSRRIKRLEEQSVAWHAANGDVQVELADGSMAWVTLENAALSRRAREAANAVINDRVALEPGNAETSAIAPVETSDEGSPGIVELWGPQAAVGVLGLVLMGVAARLLLFSGEGDWSKIE